MTTPRTNGSSKPRPEPDAVTVHVARAGLHGRLVALTFADHRGPVKIVMTDDQLRELETAIWRVRVREQDEATVRFDTVVR